VLKYKTACNVNMSIYAIVDYEAFNKRLFYDIIKVYFFSISKECHYNKIYICVLYSMGKVNAIFAKQKQKLYTFLYKAKHRNALTIYVISNWFFALFFNLCDVIFVRFQFTYMNVSARI
jgi:hypothetical protein